MLAVSVRYRKIVLDDVEMRERVADGLQAPWRTPSLSTRLVTSSTLAALVALPTRTTCSGSLYEHPLQSKQIWRKLTCRS